MVPILALWLPILIAAVLGFAASSVMHMVLGYHKNDFSGIEGEDDVMDALRPANLAPGDYFFPHAESPEVLKSKAWGEAVEYGRWPEQVRPYTANRQFTLQRVTG